MFIIRWVLGRIILFFDFVFSPKRPKLNTTQQEKLDAATASLSLYQLPACPFCVKVRRAMKRNGLNIALKNINQSDDLRQELIEKGGKRTVPCLRIEKEDKSVEWMYESKVIVHYLQSLATNSQ